MTTNRSTLYTNEVPLRVRLRMSLQACEFAFRPKYRHRARKYRAIAQRVRLSPDEILRLASATDRAGGKLTKFRRQVTEIGNSQLRNIRVSELEGQFVAAQAVEELLNAEASCVKRCINVGARFDMLSAFLAPRYRDREFVSVDFSSSLSVMNAPFKLDPSPNWTFRSGYILDLLTEGDIDCRNSVVVFKSVSPLMSPPELNAVLEYLGTHAPLTVLFCEAYWPRPLYFGRPDRQRRSHCAGRLGNFNHPYRFLLESHGFEVERHQMVVCRSSRAAAMQVISGRRPAT